MLTYQYGCNKEVLHMMQLQELVTEQHNFRDDWLKFTAISGCKTPYFIWRTGMHTSNQLSWLHAPRSRLRFKPTCQAFKWLLPVHLKDVVKRLPVLRASITDSTRKLRNAVFVGWLFQRNVWVEQLFVHLFTRRRDERLSEKHKLSLHVLTSLRCSFTIYFVSFVCFMY